MVGGFGLVVAPLTLIEALLASSKAIDLTITSINLGEPGPGLGAIAATTHLTRDGKPKIVARCAYPLTGERPVETVVTEHACFEVVDGGLLLTEVAPGTSLHWVEKNTAAAFSVSDNLAASRAEGGLRATSVSTNRGELPEVLAGLR